MALLAGCSNPGSSANDAGASDSGANDASAVDVTSSDTGVRDSGLRDANPVDTIANDASSAIDAPDEPVSDGSTAPDAAAGPDADSDAGTGSSDAGASDAGPSDTGSGSDASIPDLYFAGDFQNVTTDNWNWTGGWSELGAISLVRSFGTFQIGNGNTLTVVNPVAGAQGYDNGRNVFKITLADASHSVAKANFGIEFWTTTDLPVYHTSHRMYLNDTYQYISDNLPDGVGPTGTVLGWMTLMEIWNQHDPNLTGDPGGSARWTVALRKAAGTGQPWTWIIRGEYMQPDAMAYMALLQGTNTTTPVPIQQWFTLDLYMLRGDGQGGRPNGHIVLTMTPDGGAPVELINVTGPTMYPARPDLLVRDVEPLKAYTSQALMNWVLGNGRDIEVMYNDFKWYRN